MVNVSFIITSYNYEKYIEESIKSVIAQTYRDWELIVVDDGSVDSSRELIQKFCNEYENIHLYTHENNQNKGLIESVKLGIQKSTGKYIVFLESDDYISANYLSVKMEVFSKYKDVGIVTNLVQTVNNEPTKETSKFLQRTEKYWKKNNYPHNVCDTMHFFNCIPTFSCVMIEKSLLNKCDFNSPCSAFLDWWLWAQVSTKTNFFCIQENLTFWRMHTNSYIKKMQKNTTSYKKILIFYNKLNQILPKINCNRIRLKYTLIYLLRLVKYTYLNIIHQAGRK